MRIRVCVSPLPKRKPDEAQTDELTFPPAASRSSITRSGSATPSRRTMGTAAASAPAAGEGATSKKARRAVGGLGLTCRQKPQRQQMKGCGSRPHGTYRTCGTTASRLQRMACTMPYSRRSYPCRRTSLTQELHLSSQLTNLTLRHGGSGPRLGALNAGLLSSRGWCPSPRVGAPRPRTLTWPTQRPPYTSASWSWPLTTALKLPNA